MDFLNKAFAQVRDLFLSMSPGGRVTTALLLVVVVVSLGYLATFQGDRSDQYLMGGEHFAPSHLPAMEAAFAKANLASYQVEGSRIRIPRGEQASYMAALAEGGALPPQFSTYLDQAINASNVFESTRQREERLRIGRQKELAQILSWFPDIDHAAVLYDTETRSGLNRTRVTTASVSVKPGGTGTLDEDRVPAIRHLVATAIAGLRPENVTVTDLNRGHTYYGNSGGGGTLDDPLAARKRHHEEEYKAKILRALAFVPGINVAVDVTIDRRLESRTQRYTPDTKPVVVWSHEDSEFTTREGAEPAARPGYAAQGNQPVSVAANAAAGGPREERESSQREEQATVGAERTEFQETGGAPERVSVAIAVPTSYFEDVWRRQNGIPVGDVSPVDADDVAQIVAARTAEWRRLVAQILPDVPGVTDRTDLVEITQFDDLVAPAAPPPSLAETTLVFLGEYWKTLGLFLLAGMSLLMLRSMIRSAADGGQPAPISSGMAPPGSDEEEEAEGAASRLKRRPAAPTSLRDELSQLVQEDPDTAASILKAWIGSVA